MSPSPPIREPPTHRHFHVPRTHINTYSVQAPHSENQTENSDFTGRFMDTSSPALRGTRVLDQ